MQTTIRGQVLQTTPTQDDVLDRLIREQEAAKRVSFCRICEGKSRTDIVQEDLKPKFPLNTRYLRDAHYEAKATHKSAEELMDDPSKVIFGGRKWFYERQRGKITRREWKRRRNRHLVSRGDRSKNGNLNVRLVRRDDGLYLRVTCAPRTWIYVPVGFPKTFEGEIDQLLEGDTAYKVMLIRDIDEDLYSLRVSYAQELPAPSIGFKHGALGIDCNQKSIDVVVTNEQGQFQAKRVWRIPEVEYVSRGKREHVLGNVAKEVAAYARYWKRGVVVEKLKDVSRGQSNQHAFTHRFLDLLKRRLLKEGIEVKEVNPALTSRIGQLKYTNYYQIDRQLAAAYVIARRGLGFREALRGRLRMAALESLEERRSGHLHEWSLWNAIWKAIRANSPVPKALSGASLPRGYKTGRTIGAHVAQDGGRDSPGGNPGGYVPIPGRGGPSIVMDTKAEAS